MQRESSDQSQFSTIRDKRIATEFALIDRHEEIGGFIIQKYNN